MAAKLSTRSGIFGGSMKSQHMDAAAASNMFNSLNLAIDQIFTKQTSLLSFNELYNYGYQLVIHKHGDLLYNGVAASIRSHLLSILQHVTSAPNETLLKTIKDTWEEFKVTTNNLKDILMYLDRTYVTQFKKVSVSIMMVQVFREVVILNSEVAGRLRTLLLDNVFRERQGLQIDKELMKAVLGMLVELGPDGQDVYEDFFESHFLAATRVFYRQLSQEYFAQNTCPEYMCMAEIRLGEENERVIQYLAPASEQKLKHVVETELILTHARGLIDMEASGCNVMFRDNKTDDLRRMYNLFFRLPSTLDSLRDFMTQYVKHCGRGIINDQESNKDPLAFVQAMLDLKAKFDHIIVTSFRNEKRSQKKLKEAFEDFVNHDTRCAAHLAGYSDDLLRGGLKECTEEAADEQLDRVIVIFRYLTDKDIFESFYKSHLSKRLLGGKSVSDELEKAMISKLKVECGYQFTSKLEGMFQDIKQSRSFQDDFRRSSDYALLPIDLEVQLLSSGYWPLAGSKNAAIRLPPVINACCEVFSKFYYSKYDGRKLVWISTNGTADIKATFPHGKHELSVTTYQMCILLAFNDNQSLTYAAIMALCGVEDDKDLQPHILGLCSKLKILVREGPGKYVGAGDTFWVNEDFKSKFKRIKVPLVMIKEPGLASAATANGEPNPSSGDLPPAVEEERRHITEAAIVRIMKTRKSLTHNDLIGEVTRQVSNRFSPQPMFIKKRIESLIERDYLSRDKEDARLYLYVA